MNTLRIQFCNANDDHNTPSGALPNYKLSARLPDIVGKYPNTMAHIIVLSEILASSVDMIRDYLIARGYVCETMAYAPGQSPDMSFYHLIAHKADMGLNILEYIRYWFTSSPYEALNSITRLQDNTLKSYIELFERGTLCLVASCESKIFIIAANHFSLMRIGRPVQYVNGCATSLVQLFNTLRSSYPGATIITGADFNAFDETNHVSIICKNANLYDITPPGDTFCAYPWDFGMARPHTGALILAARDHVKSLRGQA